MKKVLIIQALAKQYRGKFFENLYIALKHEGIQLKVAYGDPNETELKKSDNINLNDEFGVKVKNRWFFGNKILFQPLLHEILQADLVIVEQANKYINNYILLMSAALHFKKVAFWGHGRNRQSQSEGVSEWLKKKTLNTVDWWFAYTEGTKKYLVINGVSPEKITNVQNSIDTEEVKEFLLKINEHDLNLATQQIGIQKYAKLGLFCGGLYRDKNLEFLIESAKLIKARVPDFELLIIGSGEKSEFIKNIANQESWIHYLGPQFGFQKIIYFRLAHVFLIPGAVGLAILDSFAAGLPLFTTGLSTHGPEVEYLHDGVNGFMTQPDCELYAHAVSDVLTNPALLDKLSKSAVNSSNHYTLQAMVNNFKTGIIKCLAQ
jgi:glycosyltransferase involved in cell wall biosynthesis